MLLSLKTLKNGSIFVLSSFQETPSGYIMNPKLNKYKK
jgi:hypothetical protein